MSKAEKKRDVMEDKYFHSSIESEMDHYLSSEEEIEEHEAKRKNDVTYERENEMEEYER